MKINKLLANIATVILLASALLAGGHGTHWGYTGHGAPEHWGDLSTDFSICKNGKSQSPINISSAVIIESSNLQKILFDYSTQISSVVNNGHTIQVNFDKGSSIVVDEIEFSLIQLHFHTPSENQIDGKSFPLEGHFVHAAKDGSLAVVALMFEDGAKNLFIEKVWAKMPHKVGQQSALSISAKEINALLPLNKEYYRFAGSLTTPPCSEGVRWLVLKNYTTISKSQVKEFIQIFNNYANNRPIQPINARKVMK